MRKKIIIIFINFISEKAKLLFTEGVRLDPDNARCRNALKKARLAEDLKDKGNDAIKEDKFDEAIEL